MYSGLKLKELIAKKGLTYEEIAEKTGLSKTTVYLVVNEKQEIKISVLEKIADALDVPITYFFGETDKKVAELERTNKMLSDTITLLKAKLKRLQLQAENTELKYQLLISNGESSNPKQKYLPAERLNSGYNVHTSDKYPFNTNQDDDDSTDQLTEMIRELDEKIAKNKSANVESED